MTSASASTATLADGTTNPRSRGATTTRIPGRPRSSVPSPDGPAATTGTDSPSSASTAANRSADPVPSAQTVTEYPSSASAPSRAASRERSPWTGSHPCAVTTGVAVDDATETRLSTGAGHRSSNRS